MPVEWEVADVAAWVTDLVETIGLPGIAALMFLEIPVPVVQSEIVMTFSGFTASRGDLNVYLVVVAGVAGSQVGSVALYGAVRPVSEDTVNGFLARYGGWLGFDEEDLESAQEKFRRYDHWAVLIGRLLPGLRSFIAIPAGIQRMPFREFFVLNLIGTVFWVSVLTYLGTVLGENYDLVDQYSSYVTYGLVGAVGLYVVIRLAVVGYRRFGRSAEESTGDVSVGSE